MGEKKEKEKEDMLRENLTTPTEGLGIRTVQVRNHLQRQENQIKIERERKAAADESNLRQYYREAANGLLSCLLTTI